MEGLPPEAVTWRKDGLPFAEELAAQQLERADAWARAQFEYGAGKRVRLPPPVVIERPGQALPEAPKVETDPRVIAAWFANHMGGG